jgi:regulator of PEP synthase PpsR (kinase-PPPase family)
MAMQYGVHAANYPLTSDDFETMPLPKVLSAQRSKLFGLTISPERLARIRHERKPNSRYSAIETCRAEIRAAQDLYQRARVPWVDTTTMSVEEIAVTILHKTGLSRQLQM